jgi:ABC-2 type transport system permease protein
MPLWMLSGALFPAGQAQPWIRAIMQWNPLRHPLALLEAALTPWSQAAARTALGLSWTVTVGGGLLLLALAVYAVERNPRGETR